MPVWTPFLHTSQYALHDVTENMQDFAYNDYHTIICKALCEDTLFAQPFEQAISNQRPQKRRQTSALW